LLNSVGNESINKVANERGIKKDAFAIL